MKSLFSKVVNNTLTHVFIMNIAKFLRTARNCFDFRSYDAMNWEAATRGVLQEYVSLEMCKIHRKTPEPESLI